MAEKRGYGIGLQCYFEGRRELFRGLAIDKLEKDWVAYPVIRLDLSNGKYYALVVKQLTNYRQ